MEFTDRVLILRIGKFREADLWVRFLSPMRGILSAFAFGAARSRRRFSGCLDIFNDVLCRVQRTKNGLYLVLQEAVLMQGPIRLRQDWRRLGLAMNCLKFLEAFGVGIDGAAKAHTLFSDVLALLEDDEQPPMDLPLLFRARLAFDQGYSLRLAVCGKCGALLRNEPICSFIVAEGIFCCNACRRQEKTKMSIHLGREILDVLYYVQEYSPLQWRQGCLAGLSSGGRKECARIVDLFIQRHVGLQWMHNRFIKI